MKPQNENTALLNSSDKNKIYGTATKQILSDLKKPLERKSCKLDADGISATCGAYSGETTAGATAFTSKTLCTSLNPALVLTIVVGAGLVSAVCTFFVCRKVINKVNNPYQVTNNIAPKQNEKKTAHIMKK